MKKLILIVGIAMFATASQASYLYWQVTSNDYSDSNIFGGDASVVALAQVTALANGSAANQWQAYPTVAGTTYNSVLEQQSTPVPSAGGVYIVDGTFDDGYIYYIELYNNSGTLVSRSAGMTSNDLVQYTQQELVSVSSVLDPGSTVSVWHGAGYTPVPEPTSAMLMLFGAAFLGLKRKNRSIA